MSVSRLFQIVYLLLEKRRITARDLAAHLEVSVRTIYRDVDALSAAGVPIYAIAGRNGGLSLMDHFILERAVFSEDEQLRLLTALQSLPGEEAAANREIRTKLAGLFGRREPDWLQVDLSPWGFQGEDARFHTLKGAILGRKQLSFTYLSSCGQRSRRQVLPARLSFKGRAWYLQGWCLSRKSYRTFRLSRILDLEVGERFERTLSPPPIGAENPDSHVCVSLHLYFSPAVAYRIFDEFSPECILHNSEEGLLAEVLLPEDEWLYSYLLSFGTGVRVLSPVRVREKLAMLIEQMGWNHSNLDILCHHFRDIIGASHNKEVPNMEQKFCQSCGMPIDDPALRGTESGGGASEHYCKYCYQDGAFVSDMTMEEMIDFCVPIMVREHPGMTDQMARAQMLQFFPQLQRWKA